MKIYTRTGDDGTTGLFGGGRVRKDDARMQCIGAVDELNASLGLAAIGVKSELSAQIRQIQNELFVIGSHLSSATPGDPRLPPLPVDAPHRLEAEIDKTESALEPLKQFILPGGSEPAARLHLARTVCRRAERWVIALDCDPLIVCYLNRLSDWLFVQARRVNRDSGVADIPWEK